MSGRTVREALKDAAQRFAAAGCQTPRLDAELLLAHVFGTRRDALYREPERTIEGRERHAFDALVERRVRREPVAYLTGRRAFRTIELEVGPGVLVPRPETETLVDVALEELARLDAQVDRELGLRREERQRWPAEPVPRPASRMPRVLDMGTGSGCVALALAREHPGVRVTGVDVDVRALEHARANAERLGLATRVELLRGDLFEPVREGDRFDLVVANPPYLSEAEIERVEREVRVFEPRHALVAGRTGLEAYRRLVPGAQEVLVPGGLLAVEAHEGRVEQIEALFDVAGYLDVVVRDDLGGAPRVIAGRTAA